MRHSFMKATFDPSNAKTYEASCHCGQIRLSADVSPPLENDHEVVVCNCSICIRGGDWHIYLPETCVRYSRGKEQLREYHYLRASHNFCPTCGTRMSIHLLDLDQNAGDAIVSLNVRTFLGIDDAKIKIHQATWMKDEPPVWNPDTVGQETQRVPETATQEASNSGL